MRVPGISRRRDGRDGRGLRTGGGAGPDGLRLVGRHGRLLSRDPGQRRPRRRARPGISVVLAVRRQRRGTTLLTNSDGSYNNETAWVAGGGGPSIFEYEPYWQSGIAPPTSSTCVNYVACVGKN